MRRRRLLGATVAGIIGVGAGCQELSTNDQRPDDKESPVPDISARSIAISDSSAEPNRNGEIRRDGADVKVYSGGDVRNLSNLTHGVEDRMSVFDDIASGSVAYIGAGVLGSVDPSETDRPVQTAINALDASDAGGGVIYLPPGTTREVGPIHKLKAKRIIGTGNSTTTDSERNCILEITGNNPAFESQGDANEYKHAGLDNLVLRGTGQSSPAFHFEASGRDFQIGRLTIENFRDRTNGVFWFDTEGPFSSTWGNVLIRNCDGPGIKCTDAKPQNVSIGTLVVGNDTRDPAIFDEGPGPRLAIGALGVGKRNDQVWKATGNGANGGSWVGHIVFEPSRVIHTGKSVFELANEARFTVEVPFITGSGGLQTVASIYELDRARNCHLPQPSIRNDASVTNAVLDITGEPSGHCYYYGPSKDVRNSAGSNTGRVRCLASAGTGRG